MFDLPLTFSVAYSMDVGMIYSCVVKAIKMLHIIFCGNFKHFAVTSYHGDIILLLVVVTNKNMIM